MDLTAIAIGDGVPDGNFTGAVEHIYPQVCLLTLSDRRLLTLATPAVGHLPNGITVGSSSGFAFGQELKSRTACCVQDGVLSFADIAFRIDLRAARRWRCDLAALKLDLTVPEVRRAWRATRAALRRDGRSDRFRRSAAGAIDTLSAATGRFALADASGAVDGLVGLGEGTTPAGDDFLIGYSAGLLSSTADSGSRRGYASALCARIKTSAATTSRISRVYLEAAAGGQISERLYALTAQIAAGAPDDAVDRAAQRALSVGHSSGACAVLGLLIGCAGWPLIDVAEPVMRMTRGSSRGEQKRTIVPLLSLKSFS
jgi:hypothetical protein